jgi:hypothetical protein
MEHPFPRFRRLRFAVYASTSLLMTAAPAKAAASSDAAGHDQDATDAAIHRAPAGTRYEVVWREPSAPDGQPSTGI